MTLSFFQAAMFMCPDLFISQADVASDTEHRFRIAGFQDFFDQLIIPVWRFDKHLSLSGSGGPSSPFL